jgi:NAD(P)-dependent dehydrogenase (short-subunit alcohol dehydrogenase family)
MVEAALSRWGRLDICVANAGTGVGGMFHKQSASSFEEVLSINHWLGLVLVVSPVYMTNMLVRHTGKRLLEKHMARSKGAAYADYVSRTSGFFPWPPRRPARPV